MAGGLWSYQNKVLPGVYINVKSRESVNVSIGERGTVAICEPLSWGETGKVMTIIPGEDLTPYIGYDLTNEKALFLREMMKGSDTTDGPSKILLYRPAGTDGAAASITVGALTATAKYPGVRGNDISIIIESDPDAADTFIVSTVIDGAVADAQTATAISGLKANDWVTFTGSGEELTATAGAKLEGGADGAVTVADYSAFLTAIEAYPFDILAYDGEDSTVMDAIYLFMQRLNEKVGRKCQAVMAGDGAALNSKYVIAVHNGVTLSSGTAISANQAVWWVAGVEAGAKYNESLTYAQYPGTVSANPKLTDTQAQAAIEAGKLCFIDNFDIVKICTDINSKTQATVEEGAEFKKNRVMRTINQFCNDVQETFARTYIGKTDNNEDGRMLLRTWIVGYLNEMQANNGIQNFVADDVSVEPGAAVDAVLINVAIQPVDSIEKIYMTVTVSTNGATVAEV